MTIKKMKKTIKPIVRNKGIAIQKDINASFNTFDTYVISSSKAQIGLAGLPTTDVASVA